MAVFMFVFVYCHDGSRRLHTGALGGLERQRVIVQVETTQDLADRHGIGTGVDE